MKKSEQFEREVRLRARQILDGPYPEATCSSYMMDNITARTFINKLMKKVETDIRMKSKFNMKIEIEQKMVQIMKSRLLVLNKN